MIRTATRTGCFVLLAVLFLFGPSPRLFAQGIEPGYDDPYYANPDLTREQAEKIRKLEESLDKELSPLHQRLRSLYREVHGLETAASPDPRKIDAKWAEIDRLENDIRDREIRHEQKMAEIAPPIWGGYGYPGVAYGGWGNRGRMGGGYGGGYGRAGAGYGYGGYGRAGAGYGYGTGARGYAGRGLYGGVRLGRGPGGAGLGRLSNPRFSRRGRWYR